MADEGRQRSSSGTKTSTEDKDGSGNKFANDGSFMAMFRKRMEEENAKKEAVQSTSGLETSAPVTDTDQSQRQSQCAESSTNSEQQVVKKTPKSFPFVGKRRGTAPVLKTGAVKKNKKEEDKDHSTKKDAWAQYLAEVKKYKEQSCQEENKTRPLVK